MFNVHDSINDLPQISADGFSRGGMCVQSLRDSFNCSVNLAVLWLAVLVVIKHHIRFAGVHGATVFCWRARCHCVSLAYTVPL